MFFKMRSAYFVAALSSALTVAAVASAAYKVDSPSIVVHAKGPLGLSITGKSSTLKVSEDDKNVTFKTFINTIDTGNSMRNTHLQERLGKNVADDGTVSDVLEIKLKVAKDKIDSKKGGTAPGKLTFHGVEKDVTVTYKVDGKHVKASFPFNVHNHFVPNKKFTKDDIEKVLCKAGVCADPAVTVDVDFDLKD